MFSARMSFRTCFRVHRNWQGAFTCCEWFVLYVCTCGYVYCIFHVYQAALRWKGLHEILHKKTMYVWRNQRFIACVNCNRPIFNVEAHRRAVLNKVCDCKLGVLLGISSRGGEMYRGRELVWMIQKICRAGLSQLQNITARPILTVNYLTKSSRTLDSF
jgi:hypothetical protein